MEKFGTPSWLPCRVIRVISTITIANIITIVIANISIIINSIVIYFDSCIWEDRIRIGDYLVDGETWHPLLAP